MDTVYKYSVAAACAKYPLLDLQLMKQEIAVECQTATMHRPNDFVIS